MSQDALFDSHHEASPFSDENEVECNNIVLKNFIETFETLPELWDVTNHFYKNKYKRNEALDRLLSFQKQWMPNATRDDVRKKINSLRSNFRKEMKKIETSKRSGIGSDDVYKPKSWTFQALLFLHKTEKRNTNTNSASNNCDIDNESENTPNTSACFSSINPVDIQPPPRSKKKKSVADQQVEVLEKACQLLSQSQNQDQASAAVDPLAIVWTRKLQTLNSTQRMLCEKAINDILFEAQCNNLHRDSVQINILSSTPYSNISTPSPAQPEPCINTPVTLTPVSPLSNYSDSHMVFPNSRTNTETSTTTLVGHPSEIIIHRSGTNDGYQIHNLQCTSQIDVGEESSEYLVGSLFLQTKPN